MDINLSASSDGERAAKKLAWSVGHDVAGDVALEQHIWKMLPDEILEKILMRLPHCIRCRLRCVCQKWKRVLVSLPYQTQIAPAYTIWGKLGDENDRFYCHSEKKWFALSPNVDLSSMKESSALEAADIFKRFTPPLNVPPYSSGVNWNPKKNLKKLIFPLKVYPSSKTSWEVVDVDAGFICYMSTIEGSLWLCVSNPLTSFFQIIPPDYPRWNPQDELVFPWLKLLVNRETHSFKVVWVIDSGSSTAICYINSTTSRWYTCKSCPSFCPYSEARPDELFAWRNTVYAYDKKQYRREGNFVIRFEMESGSWKKVTAQFPREVSFETNCFIMSDNNHLMLIQSSFRKDSRLSVWKLLDDGLSHSTSLFSEWEKIVTAPISIIEESLEGLVDRRLERACLGREYICFMLGGHKAKEGVGARDSTWGSRKLIHRCVKYSFTTQVWSVIPCPGSWGIRVFKLFHWEPSPDIRQI